MISSLTYILEPFCFETFTFLQDFNLGVMVGKLYSDLLWLVVWFLILCDVQMLGSRIEVQGI